MAKHNYPKTRKPANRTYESYLRKDRKLKVVTSKRKLTEKQALDCLESLNIIEFTSQILHISLYPAQETILRSLYGLSLSDEHFEIYKELTGLDREYERGVEKTEAVLVLGARSGKSFLSSICALYEATVRGSHWRQYLNPGEIAYVIVVATRLDQARSIIGKNCDRMLSNSLIADMVEESWQTELSLTNGISIISLPCSSTAGRGLPICCLILDEVGWFQREGPKADVEVFDALRPRMSQFRGAKMFAISTPAAKEGLLWTMFDQGHVPGRLVVQGRTEIINPSVDAKFLESEKLRNPDNFSREFLAEFSESVSAFFPFSKINECCILPGDLLPDASCRYYCGLDQSGFSGRDRFALAISHRQKDEVTIDMVRSWATTDAKQVIGEIRSILKAYRINSVALDRYGAGWPKQRFEEIGIEAEVREALPAIFQNLKSLLMANCIRLPDTKAVKTGLARTSAFYGRNGSLSISHERTAAGHGDEIDALATAAWLASSRQIGGFFSEALELQQKLQKQGA
ncbi:MAG: hypothetical protein ACYTEQ_14430 [Planctomycetota bacterium]|jgi:hypothetical protein